MYLQAEWKTVWILIWIYTVFKIGYFWVQNGTGIIHLQDRVFSLLKNLDPYNKTDLDFGDLFQLTTDTIQVYWYAVFLRKNTPTSRQTQL